MITGLAAERLEDVNPQEALPRTTRRRARRGQPLHVQIAGDDTAFLRDRELYRMRTRPELYDDWMRDLIENARAQAVEALGDLYDWDCDHCQTAVLTYRLADPCPRCGVRS